MSNRRLLGDLLSEILCRLPVKTLIRFKCVCKPWLSLISDPNFIKSHLLRASLDPQNESLIVHTETTDHKDLITVLNIGSIEAHSTQTIEFPHSVVMQLLGSINGIVCLSDRAPGLKFIVWNPATRECKLIKFRGIERHQDEVFVGFGFDSVLNDFRIICIFPMVEPVTRFYVYSCNEDSWKEIKPNYPDNICDMWSGVTVKGNPYWMGVADDNDNDNGGVDKICVSFDVQNEVFHFLPLPKYERDSEACLGNLKDSLAFVMSSSGTEGNKLAHVYVLDGTCGTWNKIYTVGPIPLRVQKVLPCFKNGEIIIEGCKGKLLYSYDPISKAIKDLWKDKATKFFCDVFSHTESLVTIKKVNRVEEEGITENKPSKRNSRDDIQSKVLKLKL